MVSTLGGAGSSHRPPTSTSSDKIDQADSLNNPGIPPQTDQDTEPITDAAGNSTAGSTAVNEKGID